MGGADARATVEMMPRGISNHIYRDLSRTLGILYEEIPAATASGCGGGNTDARLACNVTVRVELLVAAVERAADWTSRRTGGVKFERDDGNA